MLLILDGVLTTIAYLISAFLLFYIGKLVYQLFHPGIKVNYQLVEEDNFAFAISYVGYYIGLLLAIGAAVIGESEGGSLYDLLWSLLDIAIYGGLSILLLNLSVILNDKVIFSKFNVKKELIEDKNIGTGIIEAGNSIATGLIILGAIHGEGFGQGGPIITAILYWVLGQVIMYIVSLVYNAITPYDIHDHIEKKNAAVAIGYAGALIAVANLIRFALMHDFDSWIVTLEDVGIDTAIGLLLLPLTRFLADKILLPGQNLTDELINQEHPNHGAAFIEAFAYIGGSILITWSL
ncbi:MAG: DUF350 domain-containing protein [Cyclobacteriaceae bacterium]